MTSTLKHSKENVKTSHTLSRAHTDDAYCDGQSCSSEPSRTTQTTSDNRYYSSIKYFINPLMNTIANLCALPTKGHCNILFVKNILSISITICTYKGEFISFIANKISPLMNKEESTREMRNGKRVTDWGTHIFELDKYTKIEV